MLGALRGRICIWLLPRQGLYFVFLILDQLELTVLVVQDLLDLGLFEHHFPLLLLSVVAACCPVLGLWVQFGSLAALLGLCNLDFNLFLLDWLVLGKLVALLYLVIGWEYLY